MGKNTTAYLKRVAWVGRDAKLDWAMGMLSDGKILADYDSDLYVQGARAEMNVIAIILSATSMTTMMTMGITGTAQKRKMLAGASILTKTANRVKGARKA